MRRDSVESALPAIGLILALVPAVVLLGAGVTVAIESAPPEKGGQTESLGMPPIYKGRAGFELQWYRPSTLSAMAGLGNLGFWRDLGSPVVGIAALGIEGYAGYRAQEFAGGLRAYYSIPSFHIILGYDRDFSEKQGSFLLGLDLPIRRGGIFGRGTTLDIRWLPGYDATFSLGIGVPLWGKNLGKTRPRHDSVKLEKRSPERLEPEEVDPALHSPLENLRERALWIARLSQPFSEYAGADAHKAMAPVIAQLKAHIDSSDVLFPNGHTLDEEIRIYHEMLDHLFTLAVTSKWEVPDTAVAGIPEDGSAETITPDHNIVTSRITEVAGGQSTEAGRQISAVARKHLLNNVLYPYDYLLGQRKSDDQLYGFIAVAQTDFARWLLSSTEMTPQRAKNAFYIFQTLCDIVEENRRELHERWEDSRFVWLPLQYGLKPEEHDTQTELNDVIERATRASFTVGNHVWYVLNEQFQWEIARSVMRAEDYHVLWIHDIRGHNGQGKPDELAYAQVRVYLRALIDRVRAYDESGKLPTYMIFLDQHYFEINKSRLWLRLLSDPLNHRMRLLKGYEAWEQELQQMQAELRAAVAASVLLQIERSQYGQDWLKDRIKVHVNITNPADPSFWSWHTAGIIPMPDNNMRDHRKIAFYDITEEDPYRGMAMFTGMGIGEHYIGSNWEDRAIMIRGPGALEVKNACRRLVRNQGFEADEVPYPLRPRARNPNYDELIARELAKAPNWVDGNYPAVLQLHNETGFVPKPINPSKAVMYSLMPRGSVLQIPDSLWQSYIYASLLAGSALRGCRVLIIAPTQESAPSAGSPQMARAHGLLGRLIVFSNAMLPQIEAESGLLKIGLYKPRQGVGDLAGRFKQASQSHPAWADRIYNFHSSFQEQARNAAALLDSIGYQIQYLTAADSIARPKLHLKANAFASQVGWDKLTARPEWAGVLRGYIKYLALQSTPAAGADDIPDVQAIPAVLEDRVRVLIESFLSELTITEREKLVYFFTVGSANMDYRSMSLDGEVMTIIAGWSALNGMMDFLLLSGLSQWLESTEELDQLLPPPGGFTRSMADLIKLML